MARKAKDEVEQSTDNSKSSLISLRDTLSKKVKGVHISIMAESELAKRDVNISTPSYDLNRILTGDLNKGLFEKTWTLIVGPEHSFKSSFTALCLANAQKRGYTVVIIDTEGAWDSKFIERWGLDPSKVLYIYTPWVDEVKVVLAQILESSDEKFAIALDSIGGLDKKKILVDALAGDPKADQGGLQKDLKPMYKLLLNIVKTKKSIAIATGHYYGSPGTYGDGDAVGGGKAAKLLPDIIVSLKKSKIIDSEKNVIGNRLKAITLKNRIYPPFSEGTIEIDFVHGLNRFAGLADLAVAAKIISKGGAGWYTWVNKETGEEIKMQGEVKLQRLFEENEKELIDELNSFIESSGFSTINNELMEAESLMEDKENGVFVVEEETFE